METLDQIGLRCGTDKAADRHNYLRHYAAFFERRRQEALTLIEIGVFDGASVRMWRDYFPHAAVIGADIDERCLASADDRISIHIGDQSDATFLQTLAAYQPDIVIDDGSHNGDAQRATFGVLYPAVKPGGFYIVEDLHTAYFGWGASFVDYTTRELLEKVVWPGGRTHSHGHGDPRNHPSWNEIQQGMDVFSRQTKSITCLSSLLVFEKWGPLEVF